MKDLGARIRKLEAAAFKVGPALAVRRFIVQGPAALPEADAFAFLREQGHDIRDTDLNIVRVVIGAEDGHPVDLPLKDLTPQTHDAASALHLQRTSGL
ncbi:hypothetical protein [Methylobacterium sp. J-076]|uniref:hypothetical protein n=1 Tax=Methylobacterium sp. J-076 TaxID=2836655 RepID=UPI001FBB9973|nr:hypothetical protein [Methylobacterium sp. J-076]MCJ2012678.1 hypothetical protein [Methylobacterium sp. J-076]